MNNKEDLKKQLIILSLILILVVIIAIILNVRKNENVSDINQTTNNVIEENESEEQDILDNLNGLLEETEDDEEYIQDETQGTEQNKITTNSGETVIVME